MTVTPVANWLSACRKSVAVSGVAVMFEVFEDIILRGVWGKRGRAVVGQFPITALTYIVLGCGKFTHEQLPSIVDGTSLSYNPLNGATRIQASTHPHQARSGNCSVRYRLSRGLECSGGALAYPTPTPLAARLRSACLQLRSAGLLTSFVASLYRSGS